MHTAERRCTKLGELLSVTFLHRFISTLSESAVLALTPAFSSGIDRHPFSLGHSAECRTRRWRCTIMVRSRTVAAEVPCVTSYSAHWWVSRSLVGVFWRTGLPLPRRCPPMELRRQRIWREA